MYKYLNYTILAIYTIYCYVLYVCSGAAHVRNFIFFYSNLDQRVHRTELQENGTDAPLSPWSPLPAIPGWYPWKTTCTGPDGSLIGITAGSESPTLKTYEADRFQKPRPSTLRSHGIKNFREVPIHPHCTNLNR